MSSGKCSTRRQIFHGVGLGMTESHKMGDLIVRVDAAHGEQDENGVMLGVGTLTLIIYGQGSVRLTPDEAEARAHEILEKDREARLKAAEYEVWARSLVT